MKTVTVNASKSYCVTIGSGLLSQLGQYAAKLLTPGKAAVISDSNVWPIYGTAVRESLEKAGYTVVSFIFPAGEESKIPQTYLSILNFLAENQLTRSDAVIALGGGVVGDIAGFAAATYLRGIACIQVPTSLLAMVDSSVGGKTAIDLPAGKNLAGAFYQPSLVLCDTDTLDSLPTEIFRDGCAEVIKYGVLYDAKLFAHLAQHGLTFDREAVIAQCVAHKRDVVMEDEFDTGARQLLNLGHTVGHGIEACSHYRISHGQAVAVGMAIIARAACAHGLCQKDTSEKIQSVLKTFSLPIACEYTAQQLYTSALSDKKRLGGTVNLIIPNAIGSCSVHPVPVTELQSFIKAGL